MLDGHHLDSAHGGQNAPVTADGLPVAEIASGEVGVPEQGRALKVIADTIGVKQEQMRRFWLHIMSFV